jgi:hypothetical protein
MLHKNSASRGMHFSADMRYIFSFGLAQREA